LNPFLFFLFVFVLFLLSLVSLLFPFADVMLVNLPVCQCRVNVTINVIPGCTILWLPELHSV
jgi:hypothetical protein